MYLMIWILVGMVVGWLAGKSLEGSGYGPSMDLVMGAPEVQLPVGWSSGPRAFPVMAELSSRHSSRFAALHFSPSLLPWRTEEPFIRGGFKLDSL